MAIQDKKRKSVGWNPGIKSVNPNLNIYRNVRGSQQTGSVREGYICT